MPRKYRDVERDLRREGFVVVRGGGEGGHRKLTHPLPGVPRVIIPGKPGDDARPYFEDQAKTAIAAARAARSRTKGSP